MIPREVEDLLEVRRQARARKDFAAADAARDRIEALGFVVRDGPEGTSVEPAPPARRLHVAEVPSVLDAPATVDVTVQWLVQGGWPEDVDRGIGAFERHRPRDLTVQHVIVDATGSAYPWPPGTEVIRLAEDPGWGAARNAGLRRSIGRVVLVVDGSVEVTGDVLGPILSALDDPAAGIVGPFGIVTDDLRTFREAPGPQVDAIEAYLMALRRDVLATSGMFDERFRFYRTADIDLSYRVTDLGYEARVVPVPLIRHEHRLWAHTPEEERERLSRRNFRRFLEHRRDRHPAGPAAGSVTAEDD
jgi:glycosyltransferase involved in cell wall biosynthesis